MAPVKKPKAQLQRTFLREWREYNNLTLEAAASRLNMSHAQLSKIERALEPYSQQLLQAASDAYGCAVHELIIRNPKDKNAVWSIQDQLLKAPEPVQKRIVAAVDALLKAG